MRIKTISCSNFRGIEQLDKLDCGQLNSFVGQNDCGKSSILKALDAFFNSKFITKDIFQGKSEDDEVSVTIQFKPPTDINPLALDDDGFLCLKKVFTINDKGRIKTKEYYICYDFDHDVENCWGSKEADLNKNLEHLGIDFRRSGRGHTNLSKIEMIHDHLEGTPKTLKCHPCGEMIKNIDKYYDEFEYPTFSIFDAEIDLSEGSTAYFTLFDPPISLPLTPLWITQQSEGVKVAILSKIRHLWRRGGGDGGCRQSARRGEPC